MKKILSVVIVLTLVLSMGVVAFATTGPVNMANITLDKAIEMGESVVGNPAISGEYTLNFETGSVSPAAGQTVPVLGNITSSSGVFTIPLDSFVDFGKYTYNFKEAVGTTAGMTYDGRDLVLTVYVVLDEEDQKIVYATIHQLGSNDAMIKIEEIDNEFDAGKLDIEKVVTGNMGEFERYFDVVVTLNPGDDVIRNAIDISGGSHEDNPTTIAEGTLSVTLKIKHGETITLQNIPDGVTYTVVETAPGDGYDEPDYDEDGDLIIITNNRGQLIDTGVNLDNLPYILILVGVAAGLVAFTFKRRVSDER